jgi:alpha-tubulin suppressor-like RCC1 family protein
VQPADNFTCGLTTGGGLRCWGALGPERPDRHVPTAVQGVSSLVTLDGGANQLCGLTADGATYCWGFGVRGVDGQTLASTDVAVRAVPEFAVRTLSVGRGHSCAIDLGGVLYCWSHVPPPPLEAFPVSSPVIWSGAPLRMAGQP